MSNDLSNEGTQLRDVVFAEQVYINVSIMNFVPIWNCEKKFSRTELRTELLNAASLAVLSW